jgi:ribosome-binding protein aMBF1 (putative translation factor)
MRVKDLQTADELHRESMKDPEYRAEWERTRLAHEVAMRVLQYRAEHGLTQTQLAKMLGMRQPHIARLEAGDHEPSLATLSRLARLLGLEFHIDITPQHLAISA